MDDGSYWHRYLIARHHTSLILGIVFMAMALIFTLTGGCLVKGQGMIYRAEDPKTFWQNVATCCLIGLIFLGLYFYTGN